MAPNRKAIIRLRVKEGKITPETGDLLLRKTDINNKIMEIYRLVKNSEGSSFSPSDLRKMDIELIPWNTKSSNERLMFFQQYPSEAFQSFNVPEFALHNLFDPDAYCRATHLNLNNCLLGTWNPEKGADLLRSVGWEHENFNKTSLRDGGDESNPKHRYEWEARELTCHNSDLPHYIAVSTHVCNEPKHILRSELMILLFTMRGAGEFAKHLEKEISPVLLISIRECQFHITEAYFDGSKVVVRFSEPIPLKLSDSSAKQQEIVNDIMRWMAAIPLEKSSKLSSLKTET